MRDADASGPGARRDPPSRAWWDVAGRIVLGLHVGLPGLLVLGFDLYRILHGEGRMGATLYAVVVGGCLQALAGVQALRGRFLLPSLCLGITLLSWCLGRLALHLPSSPPWLGPRTVPPTELLLAVCGLAWILAAGAARGRRSTTPARASAVALLLAYAVQVPGFAARASTAVGMSLAGNATRDVPAAGSRMPGGSFVAADGSRVAPERPGVIYLVNFWATWCRPCMEELPELRDLVRVADPSSVQLLAVNTEDLSAEALEGFLEVRGLGDLPVVRDPDRVRERVGVEFLPLTLVVRDGHILERVEGFRPGLLTLERLREWAGGARPPPPG